MSELSQSLSHSRWNCKYHVVFVPKRRRKKLFGEIRRQLGPIFHELARQKECRIIEGVSVNSFLDTFGPKIRPHQPRHTVAHAAPERVFCSHAVQSTTSHCIAAETHV